MAGSTLVDGEPPVLAGRPALGSPQLPREPEPLIFGGLAYVAMAAGPEASAD